MYACIYEIYIFIDKAAAAVLMLSSLTSVLRQTERSRG